MPDAPPLPAPPFLLRPYAAGDEGEVGVLLFPAWQGRGAASAAIGALRPWAFAAVGLAALTCHHAAGHAAMAALMRRLGFRPVPPRPDVAVPCGWECRAPEAMAAG